MTEYKTLKQLADELGVTKQGIFYKIRREPLSRALQPFTKSIDGTLHFTLQGETLIKQSFSKNDVKEGDDKNLASTYEDIIPTLQTTLQIMQDTISALKQQLEVKDKQIEAKDKLLDELNKRIEETLNITDQTQRLHDYIALIKCSILKKQKIKKVVLAEEQRVKSIYD